ncbi:hypothetical protein vBAfQDWS535_18 [Alcaligenes phage vB_Af_QDWS535]|nr:hypothetical protein vBAfQDWS535_18 [Alcaligenes phage vB_Af_QDWS535]
MATLQDLLGVNSQTGLGPIMTAMNSQRDADMQYDRGLASIAQMQQDNMLKNLQYQREYNTLGSEIDAINAGNANKVMASQAERYNQFGQFAAQLGDQIGKMPLEQRQQALAQVGQMIPGMSDQAIFQSILNGDPALIPDALKTVGHQIATGTGQFARDTALQSQKDDAAMARTQADNAAAMARAQMSASNAMALEQLRISAGKYNKKDIMANPSEAILKYGPEKLAAMALYEASTTDNPQEKALWQRIGQESAQLGGYFRASGATGAQTIDPSSPTGLGHRDPYGMQPPPAFGGAPQQRGGGSLPAGLPQGTVDNGNGTYTLPNGTVVRPTN